MKLIEQVKKHQRRLALAAIVAYGLLALPLAVNQAYGARLHWIAVHTGIPIMPVVPLPVVW